jgi:hypothetical protein
MPTHLPSKLHYHQFRKIKPWCFLWVDVYSNDKGIVQKVEAKGIGADLLCGFVFGWKDITIRTRNIMELLIDD